MKELTATQYLKAKEGTIYDVLVTGVKKIINDEGADDFVIEAIHNGKKVYIGQTLVKSIIYDHMREWGDKPRNVRINFIAKEKTRTGRTCWSVSIHDLDADE